MKLFFWYLLLSLFCVIVLIHWYQKKGPELHDIASIQSRHSILKTILPVSRRLLADSSVISNSSRLLNIQSVLKEDKILLFRALKAAHNHSDVIYFGGKQVKAIFDTNNPHPHLLLHGKMLVKAWKTVAELINETYIAQKKHPATREYKAVYMHNEFPAGDFVLTVLEEYRRSKLLRFSKTPGVFNITRSQVFKSMDHYQPPVVITNAVDENWGFLSTAITNRTTKWINMTNHLLLHFANHDTLRYMLDSDKIVLMMVSTHVDPKFGYHPKVISLPLGIRARPLVWQKARMLLALNYKKVYLLSINNSGWGARTEINAMVARAFNNTVQNTYTRKNNAPRKKIKLTRFNSTETVVVAEDHMVEIAQSKFVLCPSGLGFDTYRLWEVLLLGSIPIVETNPGLDRTYASLPVLVVRSFDQVTPELLHRSYDCFVKHAHDFKFTHLREDYWLGLIQKALLTANIDHVMKQHPFRHKYCDFMGHSIT